MSENIHEPIHDLFNHWRNGSGEAGQTMAQRIADWYYAIAVTHLGEADGQDACESACGQFSANAANFSSSSELVHWCQDTIHHTMGRHTPGVASMTMTGTFTLDCPPRELLAIAWQELPDDMLILAHCYGGDTDMKTLTSLSEQGSGFPLEILNARTRLKTWLHSQHDVPFSISESAISADWATMPIYESGRMTDPMEIRQFESWLLDTPDLSRDIAEFAHFAIALRDHQCMKLGNTTGLNTSSHEGKRPSQQQKLILVGFLLGLAAIIAVLMEWI